MEGASAEEEEDDESAPLLAPRETKSPRRPRVLKSVAMPLLLALASRCASGSRSRTIGRRGGHAHQSPCMWARSIVTSTAPTTCQLLMVIFGGIFADRVGKMVAAFIFGVCVWAVVAFAAPTACAACS